MKNPDFWAKSGPNPDQFAQKSPDPDQSPEIRTYLGALGPEIGPTLGYQTLRSTFAK